MGFLRGACRVLLRAARWPPQTGFGGNENGGSREGAAVNRESG
jgi:hypothetical protein